MGSKNEKNSSYIRKIALTVTPFDFKAADFQKCSPVSSAFFAFSAIVVVIGFGVSAGVLSLND